MQGYLRRLNTERDELRMSLLAYKQESLDAKHELPRVQPFRKYIRLGALEYQESHIMASHEGPQFPHSVDEPMEGTTPNTEIPDSSIHGSASEQPYTPTTTSSPSILTKGSPPTLNSLADSRSNQSQNSKEGVETEVNRPVQDNVTRLTARVQLTGSEPVYDGPYSTVYKGRWNNQEVAIKVIRTAGPSGMTREKLRRESQTWMRLRHANILSVYGLCTDDRFGEYGALVSPWCSHGISSEHLRQFSDKPAERIRLLFEVAQGLTFLHSRQPVVVHGNLKPTNILICSNGMAKLCDYGLMSLIQEEANVVHTGTERYLSKELVATEYPIPTPASDCYAFGCVALEFAYLQLPYAQHTTISDIRSDISNGLPPATRFAGSDDHPGHVILWHLLEACWRLEPNDRPSARDICVPLSAQASLIIGALERYFPL
ncbi:hypothetical protein FRC14_004834 [Serendipita sp. 396]|nr:hypothetical protein FRC14_004834 [Serendipita sp. 396]KAG8797948.1 hypothetical protein FRC16_008328 [Serendipita sp. 398]KAG8866425.1 hypothetical protein FRC20_008591 [Serendipita sp. 405]